MNCELLHGLRRRGTTERATEHDKEYVFMVRHRARYPHAKHGGIPTSTHNKKQQASQTYINLQAKRPRNKSRKKKPQAQGSQMSALPFSTCYYQSKSRKNEVSNAFLFGVGQMHEHHLASMPETEESLLGARSILARVRADEKKATAVCSVHIVEPAGRHNAQDIVGPRRGEHPRYLAASRR